MPLLNKMMYKFKLIFLEKLHGKNLINLTEIDVYKLS